MNGNGSVTHRPTILLTTTLHLDKTARLAMAFCRCRLQGFRALPAGALGQEASMRLAMSVLQCVETVAVAGEGYKSTAAPDFIVPCDDRAVQHIHMLYEKTADPAVRERVGRSLGSPEMFAVTEGRYGLLVLARQRGIPVPDTGVINSVSDLAAWHKEHPLPWVLKSDGSWAGHGSAGRNVPE